MPKGLLKIKNTLSVHVHVQFGDLQGHVSPSRSSVASSGSNVWFSLLGTWPKGLLERVTQSLRAMPICSTDRLGWVDSYPKVHVHAWDRYGSNVNSHIGTRY